MSFNNYVDGEYFVEIPEFFDDSTLMSTALLEQPIPLRVDNKRFQPPFPPDRTPLVTPHNFTVTIKSPAQSNKSKYWYSSILHRMYVDMNCAFPVEFKFDTLGLPSLFVRATMVFSDDANAQQRVHRCLQHLHDNSSNASLNEDVWRHVLRSSSDEGTNGVSYHGDKENTNSWYSVLVEYQNCHNVPSLAQLHTYKFVCKNSCSSGINRRATAIVFTLENEFGIILGRQVVGVRVCSCPRRDLFKDESTVPQRREAPAIEAPKSKKIKIEVVNNLPDDRLCTLPPLQVVGTRAAIAGLEVMVHMMEQARPSDPQPTAAAIAAIHNAIQTLRGDH